MGSESSAEHTENTESTEHHTAIQIKEYIKQCRAMVVKIVWIAIDQLNNGPTIGSKSFTDTNAKDIPFLCWLTLFKSRFNCYWT